MMLDAASTMERLRPMHLPQASSNALIFVSIFLLGVLLAVLAGRILAKRHAIRRAALAQLASLSVLPAPERLAAQARLLRQIMRSLTGDSVAKRQGADWLAALDDVFATRFFSTGAGQCFGPALYQRTDPAEVDDALAHLLARIRR